MKKYVLFIVEGDNDKREVQAIIRAATGQLFPEYYVDSYYTRRGDITSDRNTNERNIITKLNEIVIDWRNGGARPFQKISPSDVERIVHIVDTDGAFIPESSIIQTDDAKTKYYDDKICCLERSDIVARNRKKTKVLKKLIETKKIDNIPYEVLFASCNMDHVLFDDRNAERKDKDRNSFVFASRCKRETDLSDTLYNDKIGTSEDYTCSWETIQKGYNSLSRCTNINLYLIELQDLIQGLKK